MEKFQNLRLEIKNLGVDAYILHIMPRNNMSFNFYDMNRFTKLSGFTGDSGIFIVTSSELAFFTNSMFIPQALRELAYFNIVADRSKVQPWNWLQGQGLKNIGYDGELMTEHLLQQYKKFLPDCSMKQLPYNPIDKVLISGGEMDRHMIFEFLSSGESRSSKLARIREKLDGNNYLFSAVDSVAWLLNLRGQDSPCAPLFLCELLVTQDDTMLFLESGEALNSGLLLEYIDSVRILPMSALESEIDKLGVVHFDSRMTSAKVAALLRNKLEMIDPCQALKAIKNETEIAGMTSCHIRDGVAVAKFIKWFQESHGSGQLTERICADKVTSLREEQEAFQFNSFPVIAGFNANAAIIHYHPEGEVKIHGDGLFLLDSGGHYLDGTTDITRTIAVGQPTAKQKTLYTLVLKGHLALQNLVFPKGTKCDKIDAIARQFLWTHGLDYNHGTGHGVGYFSAVHEAPPGFSSPTVLESGMIITIEPGVYLDGDFGVRIENVVLVEDAGQDFLKFKPLTVVPYDKNLFSMELLSALEMNSIRKYHQYALESLSQHLDQETIFWLEGFAEV